MIIIDSGTATTFDLVDKNYGYIGGVIFPGIDISLRSLADNTAKLKKIEFYKPDSPIGKNSADCIRAGWYYGYIGSLNYLIRLYKKLYGDLCINVKGVYKNKKEWYQLNKQAILEKQQERRDKTIIKSWLDDLISQIPES